MFEIRTFFIQRNLGHLSCDLDKQFVGQCDVKHIVILPLTTITSDLKVSTYITTSISPRPTGLLAILVKICVLKEILYYYFKVQDTSFIL
jgi:hypothetical protein